jgi:hypothetical protein
MNGLRAMNPADKLVRHFRQSLLWPLQLMPVHEGAQIQKHWEYLHQQTVTWRLVEDEFTGDAAEFKERHYSEFVSFLPYVQRLLYGEEHPARAGSRPLPSPIRVFRRDDIAAARVVCSPGDAPQVLHVAHVDLYFFYDMDVVLLNVEVHADDIPLRKVQDILHRFGRAYPTGWDEAGHPVHCPHSVEWLDRDGRVMSVSDYASREKFLSFVCMERAPRIALHWAFLIYPLVLDQSDESGPLRFRLIEYHRMPLMAYLALDDPGQLARSDFVRLGLVTAAGAHDALPYSDQHCADFERRYCYDRYWSEHGAGPRTRFLCCGHALVVVGDAGAQLFSCSERGVLGQFRHQYFLLFMIAHVQKAALLMFSSRLVEALNRLDIDDAESVRRFKRVIRRHFEIFLRFTHRYWFHQVSEQAQIKALFEMCTEHLGNDALYDEVKQEITDMSSYLDSDSLRRQANTVLRLTVVTTFGLIGTIVTGFLGMNLIAAAENDWATKLMYFVVVFVPTTVLTLYTIVKSKRLSDFLEALSDERLSARRKLGALVEVWRARTPR